MNMSVFSVVAPCSVVEVCQRFRGDAAYKINTLMMEAARTSEMLVNIYQATRRYNTEDSYLQ
jgi:hypothetical protein